MKPLWLCFALMAVMFGTALCQGFNFDTLTPIATTTVTTNDIEIVNGMVEDDVFIYFFTLSPVVISKVNKSELAIELNTPDIASTRYEISAGGMANAAAIEDGHVYLMAQDIIYKVPVDNFPGYTSLVFDTDVSPVTSFISEDSQGFRYLNFPTGSSLSPDFYQVRFDLFHLPVVNATRSFPLPEGSFQASAYNNGTAFLGTFNGEFYELEMETLTMPRNFSVVDIRVVAMSIDWDRNSLYFCGEYTGNQVRDILLNQIFLNFVRS